MSLLNLRDNLIQGFIQRANGSVKSGIVEIMGIMSTLLEDKNSAARLKKLEKLVIEEIEFQTFYNKVLWLVESDGSLCAVVSGESILSNCRLIIKKGICTRNSKKMLNVVLKKHVYRQSGDVRKKKELSYSFLYSAEKMVNLIETARTKMIISKN